MPLYTSIILSKWLSPAPTPVYFYLQSRDGRVNASTKSSAVSVTVYLCIYHLVRVIGLYYIVVSQRQAKILIANANWKIQVKTAVMALWIEEIRCQTSGNWMLSFTDISSLGKIHL